MIRKERIKKMLRYKKKKLRKRCSYIADGSVTLNLKCKTAYGFWY